MMDLEGKRRVEAKVREILRSADLDTVTEVKVRELAAGSLGVDLSDIAAKKLVREVVDSYLLSACEDDNQIKASAGGRIARVNGDGFESKIDGEQASQVSASRSGVGDMRFICKLSNKRSVAIKESDGEKVVLVGEFFCKDGKRVPGSRGIGMTADQWLAFRKSFPAIEEAIRKFESQIRLEDEGKQAENVDTSDSHPTTVDVGLQPQSKKHKSKETRPAQVSAQNQDPHLTTGHVHFQPQLKKRRSDDRPAEESSQNRIHKNPVTIVRFDGKNYHEWTRRMEPYLEQLKLAYVLTDPCPTGAGAQKWMDDDYICRSNILCSLSDILFSVFSKKPCTTAKELWDELKLVYLTEEHGSKVSLVSKYMEFQMVEGKSVVAQAQELHKLADSFTPLGMYVQEGFHVNAIISKLPASWKDVGVKLMREDNLPVRVLTESLKQEEQLRKRGKRGAFPTDTGDRERKVWFCGICQKKGHCEDKCWFKNDNFEKGKTSTGAGVSQREEREQKLQY